MVEGEVQNVEIKITLPRPVLLALQEVGVNTDTGLSVLVQLAVQRDLRRRGITWWETRETKMLRVKNALPGNLDEE